MSFTVQYSCKTWITVLPILFLKNLSMIDLLWMSPICLAIQRKPWNSSSTAISLLTSSDLRGHGSDTLVSQLQFMTSSHGDYLPNALYVVFCCISSTFSCTFRVIQLAVTCNPDPFVILKTVSIFIIVLWGSRAPIALVWDVKWSFWNHWGVTYKVWDEHASRICLESTCLIPCMSV